MYDLILYDTSNYENFPIGGQLTSIRNFLKFVANKHPEFADKILLVGITNDMGSVNNLRKITIDDVNFDFLPILYRNIDLSSVKNSLRIEFLKALFKNRKRIKCKKKTVHYIHTPEAFIEVKLIHPFSKTIVFSHGSFFNMIKGFRFYRDNKFIKFGFNMFITFLLQKANYIFTLDDESYNQYIKYSNRVIRVDNSVVLPKEINEKKLCSDHARLIFAGRLSSVKCVDKIIDSLSLVKDVSLTIVGDGEELYNLQELVKKNNLENRVFFEGAVDPSLVNKYMKENDILIMNSRLEGKPMTIIEAISYGLPVITTNVGGISELVSDGVEAYYTDGTCESIAKAITYVKNNYTDMSANAIKKSMGFSYLVVNEVVWKKLEEFIN